MSETLADIAVQTLREQIFNGRLPPDSRYTEAELAAHLGLSRTPIREAALRLQEVGLVDVRPRQGILVRAVSVTEMEDVYEVLTALEVVAAGRAARRGLRNTLEIAPMHASIGNMRFALSLEDMNGWARADDAFHSTLVALSGNPEIVATFARYADRLRRARNATLRFRPLPTQSLADHEALVAAIEDGDAQKAEAIHGAHLRAAREVLTGLIRTHGTSRI